VTSPVLDGVAVLYHTGITRSISGSAADAADAAVERARANGARIAFAVNHRPALEPDDDDLVAAACSADIVFVSDDEAEALLGERRPEAIASVLDESGAHELVITSAAHGAVVRASGSWTRVDAPSIEVVDAAGAGDALAGCYLAERVRGTAPAAALRLAVAAASLSCTRWGCAASYPARAELSAFA
jgi:2-dehydro-3-deoxygluconokinase